MATTASLKLSARIGTGIDVFHNGTTAWNLGEKQAITSDDGDDLEDGYTVCLQWAPAASVEDVLGATQRLTEFLLEQGLPADKDA